MKSMNKIYWRQRFCSADLLEFSHWLMWVNLGWISFVTGIPIMSLMLISSSPWSSIASPLHIISTSWAFPGPQYPSCSDHSEERDYSIFVDNRANVSTTATAAGGPESNVAGLSSRSKIQERVNFQLNG